MPIPNKSGPTLPAPDVVTVRRGGATGVDIVVGAVVRVVG